MNKETWTANHLCQEDVIWFSERGEHAALHAHTWSYK